MIRLTNEGVTSFTSSTYTHPVLTGGNNVVYTMNHNKGAVPNQFILTVDHSDTGVFVPSVDFYRLEHPTTPNNRYFFNSGNTTLNSISVTMYRIGASSLSIKFSMAWL